MEIKLISKTLKETICSKVVAHGFDYYVSNDEIDYEDEPYLIITDGYETYLHKHKGDNKPNTKHQKIIATNNPNIDLPQVIDELKALTFEEFKNWSFGSSGPWNTYKMFKKGYNKSQKTHSFSEDDMLNLIQSLKDYTRESGAILGYDEREPKEFLDIWKEQQVKTIYYG